MQTLMAPAPDVWGHSEVLSLLDTPTPNQSGALQGSWGLSSVTSLVLQDGKPTGRSGQPGAEHPALNTQAGRAPTLSRAPVSHLTSLRSPPVTCSVGPSPVTLSKVGIFHLLSVPPLRTEWACKVGQETAIVLCLPSMKFSIFLK